MVELPCEVLKSLSVLTSPNEHSGDRHIFDNRTVGADLGDGQFHAANRPGQYEQYFELKFFYYIGLVHEIAAGSGITLDGATDVTESMTPDDMASALRFSLRHSSVGFNERSGSCAECSATFESWKAMFSAEVKVFLLRTAQLPIDVVYTAWYNEGPSCLEWCHLVDSLAQVLTSEALGDALGTVIPLDLDEERKLRNAIELARVAAEEAIGMRLTAAAGLLALENEHFREVIERIRSELGSDDVHLGVTFSELVTAIVTVLRWSYGVRFCDYLRVTKSDGKARLELIATSWAGDIYEARDNEATYSWAGGITGSVFLCEPHGTSWWVGTELLDEDPRQSPRHIRIYNPVYGKVSSFWVLPVFSGEELVGAVRFIDPEPGGYVASLAGEAEPTEGRYRWPALARAELAQVARWLGDVLPVLQWAVPGGQEDSVTSELLRYRARRTGEGSEGFLEWVPTQYLVAFLEEAARVASMKSEHRAVGCSVAIATRAGADEFVSQAGAEYASVPQSRQAGHLVDAYDLFGRVLRGAGAFLCHVPVSAAGPHRPVEYSRVVSTGAFSVPEASREYNRISELCFVDIDGERDLVRFHEEGELIADYFLNEKKGRWFLRVFSDLRRRLHAFAESGNNGWLLDRLLKLSVEYSYEGHGGLIVLAPSNPWKWSTDTGFKVDSLNVGNVERAQFASIVSVDGGTWIDSTGKIRNGGILFDNKFETSDDGGGSVRLGGARAQAALTITRNLAGSVAFMISANREIAVFAHGADQPVRF